MTLTKRSPYHHPQSQPGSLSWNCNPSQAITPSRMKPIINLITKHWLTLTLFLLSAITVLSLYPVSELPLVPESDKTRHFIAYGTLILPTAIKKPKNWLLITLVIIAWSGGIELIQPMVNRYRELLDFVANIGGLLCGWLLGSCILWLESRSVES